MTRFRWSWLPLTVVVFCAGIYAQTPSNSQTKTTETQAGGKDASQAGSKLGSPDATSAPTSGVITSGEEIEALPASGRRWEDFVVGVPTDAAQVNGGPAAIEGGASGPSDLSVDGVSLRRAFGSTSAPATSSPSQSSTGTGEAEPSGMGRTWTTGHRIAISEAALRQVHNSTGNYDATSPGGPGSET